MQAERYFGTYARFNTLSKKDAAILLGADNPIGDVFEIVFQTDNGVSTAWMKNRFGALIGFLDAELSRQLSILAAREWKLQALLSFVAFTDHPEPGHYWGQVAIICYDSNLDQAFKPFIATTAQRLSDGVRPEIDLGEQGVEQVISGQLAVLAGARSPCSFQPQIMRRVLVFLQEWNVSRETFHSSVY